MNLGGTLNLLEAVKAADLNPRPRVILVSSGVCYGNPAPEYLPVTEDCPLRPNNPYSASKGAADLLGIQHFLAHGTDVVMVRPFNHAGPRQSPSYVLSALARQVAEVEAGNKLHVEVGNLDVVRDFTDVRDVVRAYRLLAEKGTAGEVYNLGTGRGVKLADALHTLTALEHCRSRSTSIRRGCARSISPCSSPTPRSSAAPRAGHPGSPSPGPSPTCSPTGAPANPGPSGDRAGRDRGSYVVCIVSESRREPMSS